MEINRMSTLRIASSVLLVLAVFGQADVVTNIRDAARPDADTVRDAGRKPTDVIHFLGLLLIILSGSHLGCIKKNQ